MDKNYYFVLEPGGSDDGPYVLSEIRRRMTLGLISRSATLCRVGEMEWLPVDHERYAALLPPPRRSPVGTVPPPIAAADSPSPSPAKTLIAGSGIAEPITVPRSIDPIGVPKVIEPVAPIAAPVAAPIEPPAAPIAQPFATAPTVGAIGVPMPVGFVPPSPIVPHTPIESPPVLALAIPQPIPQPFAYEPPTQATPKVKKPLPRNLIIGLAAGGAGLAIAAGAIALLASRSPDGEVKDAMVRVTTASGTGAGFFIDGPDGYAYVATAHHVVDRGERVLVEREVGSDKSMFVEAYPQTEIVATDPDADLAIIRIKNVEASRFHRLPLAKEPKKDARILSYGYPGSSLAKHAGLVSKDGKILSLASFPAYDARYSRILRENAVDGLLISTDIEPGFSGGPTLNESGEVVGVNVTKDRAHVGQNGAVSVTALSSLLKSVKPASQRLDPKPDDVVALLKKVQSEYLLLPLEERSKVRETDFVSAGDLPSLRKLVAQVRREERNTDKTFIPKWQLSGQAALGIFFARLPGKLLETYRAPSTMTPLSACELTNEHLTSFLGDLSTTDKRVEQHRQKLYDNCDELAVRPLAWDLVAATMQWDGKEKDYTVTKLDKMDEDGEVYRASVRISGAANLVELWIGVDQHAVHLKLFDANDSLYAIKSPRSVAASALQGTWSMSRPRVTDAINKDAEVETTETLSISIGEERKVSIRHVITEKYYGAGNSAKQFRCNRKSTIDTGLLQSFTGTLENGVVVALPEKDAEPMGADATLCPPAHRADRIVAVKLSGDQLQLYRTDGNAYPETIQLAKQEAKPTTP